MLNDPDLTNGPEPDGPDLNGPENSDPDKDFHDPTLDGLNDNDRSWAIVQKSWKQLEDMCASAGCAHCSAALIGLGYHYGLKVIGLTRRILQDLELFSEEDIEAMLTSFSAYKVEKDVMSFEQRYGMPDTLLEDCWQGREFLKQHPEFVVRQTGTTHHSTSTQLTFAEKWSIPNRDHALFSHEGQWATAASNDGFVFLWPVSHPALSPPCVRACCCHPMPCADFVIDWSRMMTISCGHECRIVVCDLEKAEIVAVVKSNRGTADNFFLSVDGDLTAGKACVGTGSGPVKIGDLETSKIVLTMKSHDEPVYGVKADWDRNQIVSGAWDGKVKVFDARRGKATHTLSACRFPVHCLSVDFDQQLAISCHDRDFRLATLSSGVVADDLFLWDLKTGQRVLSFAAHAEGSSCINTSWEKMYVATGGDSSIVKIWDLQAGDCKLEIDCQHELTSAIDVDWERGYLMTGSADYKLKVFCIENGQLHKEFFKPRRMVSQVKLRKRW